MNKTFKVARSLTRGTVVTSEIASSRQGKTVKTIVAAAVASLVAGVAIAADGTDTEAKPVDQYTITTDTTFESGKLLEKDVKNLTLESGTLTVKGYNDVQNLVVNGGKLVIEGSDATNWDAKGFGAYAEAKDSDGNWVKTESNATVVKNAEVVVTNANFFGGKATKDTEGTKFTFDNAKVTLGGESEAKAGMIFAAGSQLEMINGSTLTVADKNFGVINLAGGTKTVDNKTIATFKDSTVNVAGTLSFDTLDKGSDTSASFSGQSESTTRAIFDKSTINVAATGNLISDDFTLANGSVLSNAGEIGGDTWAIHGSSINNASGATLDLDNLSIEAGSNVTNNGFLKVDAKLTITDGTLNTVTATVTSEENEAQSIAGFDAKDIVVEKDGTLNLLDLNSDYKASTTPDGLLDKDYKKVWDQYLVTTNLTLDGGKILQSGSALQRIKVGTASKAGSLTLDGDYSFASLVVGQKGTVTNKDSLTVTTLNLSGLNSTGDATGMFTNEGTLTVGEVVLTNDVLEGSKVINKGTIKTTADVLFKKGEDGAYSVSSFGTAISGDEDTGSILETGYTGNIKVSDLQKAQNVMSQLVFVNATLVGDDGKSQATFDEADGVVSPNATVTAKPVGEATDVTLNAKKETVLANVDTTTAETVKIEGTNLTLAGNNGTLFGTAAKTVEIASGATLALGSDIYDGLTGKVNATVTNAGTLDVSNGLFALAGGLTNSSNVNVTEAGLDAAWVDGTGTVTIDNGVFAVLGNKPVTADTPQTAAEEVKHFEHAVNVNQNITFTQSTEQAPKLGVFGIGLDAVASDAAVFAAGIKNGNVIYFAKQAKFGDGTAALDLNTTNTTNLLIDVSKVAQTQGYSAEDGIIANKLTANSQTITLVGLNGSGFGVDKDGNKTLQIAANGSTGTVTVDAQSWLYTGNMDSSKITGVDLSSGTVTLAVDKQAIDQLEDYNFAGKVIADAKNVNLTDEITKLVAVDLIDYRAQAREQAEELGLKDVTEVENFVWSQTGQYLDEIDLATNMAVAAGAFTTALDINDQVTAALDRRTSLSNLNVSRNQAGMTPWVDVFGTFNQAKRLYGEGMGYEADIYGAMLGFDYTAACGGVLGLAINVGTADANSKGIAPEVENDVDFYGISLYGSKQFGSFNVKADLGYIKTENDLSMKAAHVGRTFSESLDGDIFTFGVGGELLVNAGSFNVVPHLGLRVTQLGMDDGKYGASYDDMTVWQMPIGVAFSGTFETAGWNIAPTFDLAVVPAFGDKDAVAKYAGNISEVVRAVDTNPIQSTLGVEAQNGAWTFGLNYRLTAGGDDRMNNAFNANVRYTF